MTTLCGKCEGKGTIGAFSHIDAGRCFACSGRGRINASISQFIRDCPSRDMIRKVSWMASASDEVIESLPFEKLEAIRNFALAVANEYSFVYGLYLEKFDDVYFVKQDEMYAAMPKPF